MATLTLLPFIGGLVRGYTLRAPFQRIWRKELIVGAAVGVLAVGYLLALGAYRSGLEVFSHPDYFDAYHLIYALASMLFYVSGVALGNGLIPQNSSEHRGSTALTGEIQNSGKQNLLGFLGVGLASAIQALAVLIAAFFGNGGYYNSLEVGR